MEIKGNYRLKGSVHQCLKILVSGRELNNLGQPKYPSPIYLYDAGVEYFVAIPGKKLEKIGLIGYDSSDPGQIPDSNDVDWISSSFRFSSLSKHPKDWELDKVTEKWDAWIENDGFRTYTYFNDLIGAIITRSTGRKNDDWGELKPINTRVVHNPYVDLIAIGKGQFVGYGIIYFGGVQQNTNPGYSPFHYYSKSTGLITSSSYNSEIATNTLETKTRINTKSFTFGETYNDKFPSSGRGSTPNSYRVSSNILISGEEYSLNAVASIGAGNIGYYNCESSFKNLNTFSGLRNEFYAIISEVSMISFSASGSYYIRNDNTYNTNIETKIKKVNLSTGAITDICSYDSLYTHGASMPFYAGAANPSHGSIFNTTNINIDIREKFIDAVFYNKKNSTWSENKVYNICNIDNDIKNKILASDYQLTLRIFDLTDLSSYEEQILTIQKSEQPNIPISELNAISFQFLP